MSENIRVRFAPSPTGQLHIGNARAAILNWLFARHEKGTFILRIEDTDPERSKEEYINRIYEDLKWLGLAWDEGPDIGGKYGPYCQAQRIDIYKNFADQLVKKGHAYYCYCTPDELEKMRKAAVEKGADPGYNQRCLNLSQKEISGYEAAGRKPSIRFRVPTIEIVFDDLVKGRIVFESKNLGDFVIMRNEGIPTYNFAAVVDDHQMQITHVIRGDDHVSNTPKQIMMYHALGITIPYFAHIPMILGPDRLRLSKRHGATSVDEYRMKGYLPEAMINYLSLLSWSSISGDEILSIDRLIAEFDFKRISRSAAIFDAEKFRWMNGHYIRQRNVDELTGLAIPFLQKAGFSLKGFDHTKNIVSVLQEKIDNLEQIVEHARIFYQDQVFITDNEAKTIIRKDSVQKVLWSFLRELRAIEAIDVDIFRRIMKSVQNETGIMGKDLWMPIRVALTGRIHGPDLPQIVAILGKEKCEKFIETIVGDFR